MGNFDATCEGLNHDLLADGKLFALLKIINFITTLKSFQILLEKGWITKRETFICNECLDKYKNDINNRNSDSINNNKNANDDSYEDCKMSECIMKNFLTLEKQLGLI